MPLRMMRGTVPRPAPLAAGLGIGGFVGAQCPRAASRPPRRDGMALRVVAIITLSDRLAALRPKPSDVLHASVTRWRLPARLAPVHRFGPVAGLPFWPGQTPCPGKPGSSRSHPLRGGAPAGCDAGDSIRPPLANPAAAASISCRSRSPLRRQPRPQHEQGARQCGPIPDRKTPPLGRGRGGGRNGANSSQRSSGRSGLTFPTNARHPPRCRSVRRS